MVKYFTKADVPTQKSRPHRLVAKAVVKVVMGDLTVPGASGINVRDGLREIDWRTRSVHCRHAQLHLLEAMGLHELRNKLPVKTWRYASRSVATRRKEVRDRTGHSRKISRGERSRTFGEPSSRLDLLRRCADTIDRSLFIERSNCPESTKPQDWSQQFCRPAPVQRS